MQKSIYETAGGMVGLERLAEAWHRRVLADEVVGHAICSRNRELSMVFWGALDAGNGSRFGAVRRHG